MSGYCTYSIEARTEDGTREVPCAKARVGVALGPGLTVVVCKRHYLVVQRAIQRGYQDVLLELDAAGVAEMAAGGE